MKLSCEALTVVADPWDDVDVESHPYHAGGSLQACKSESWYKRTPTAQQPIQILKIAEIVIAVGWSQIWKEVVSPCPWTVVCIQSYCSSQFVQPKISSHAVLAIRSLATDCNGKGYGHIL